MYQERHIGILNKHYYTIHGKDHSILHVINKRFIKYVGITDGKEYFHCPAVNSPFIEEKKEILANMKVRCKIYYWIIAKVCTRFSLF